MSERIVESNGLRISTESFGDLSEASNGGMGIDRHHRLPFSNIRRIR